MSSLHPLIPHRLATALLACAAIATAPPLLAQAAREEATRQTRTFDIPASSLADALTAFGLQSGLQMSYSSALVKDLSTSGVKGTLSPQDVLARLLNGTPLEFRLVNGTTVVIVLREGQGTSGTRTLGPVRVEGAERRAAVNGVNGSRDVTATEATGSFTTGAMTIGSKAPRSIKDTPQSVSVITHEQLEQQNINDFTQALRQAPGISFAQGDSSAEAIFYSRGFAITSIQIDGGAPLTTNFAGPTGRAYFSQIDLSQYDHVEVLRGAAGLFNGYGDPSGTINLVRKKPLDHEQVTLSAEWGRWNHYRALLDATAPLAFDGELRGRMVVTWQSNEHFYEIAEDQQTLLYGVLDYDLTPTTVITAGVSQTSQDTTPWYGGLPRYQTGEDLGLPRETSLAFPWNRWNFDTTEIFASIEQQIGADWTAKLSLTRNEQESIRKVGYSSNAVNPIDHRGPRLFGQYSDFASDQLSAEATLSGAFTLFGQRQEVLLGFNRSDQDGGGLTNYLSPVTSSATAPYQPYPGGPRYCTTVSVCPTGLATPPINIFTFDPFDPLYTEPANPLARQRFSEQGQVQSLAYANLRLTAFDRLHLETGFRWSHYEYKTAADDLCTSTTTPAACVGRQIGDAHASGRTVYSGKKLSWPPAVALSYDVTGSLVAYLGYTDIYQDQSSTLDGDLEPLDPVTGENVELGLKWAARDGRLNAALSVYRIEKQGFSQQEPNIANRYKRNPDGTVYLDANGTRVIVANDGTELLGGRTDPYHACCYIQRKDQTQLSEGVDAELTGELSRGWQVSASYTFSRNEREGSGYGASDGLAFTSIQPEHLYKLWTSYDVGAAGATGWLANLTLSAGINGQSKGYRSGQTCPDGQVGNPNLATGIAPCLVSLVPYEFTVKPYAVVSSRIGYRLSDKWSAALNLENILDETYYESVGDVGGGNWYGTPRSYTLTLRGSF